MPGVIRAFAVWVVLVGVATAQGPDAVDRKAKFTDPAIPAEERVRRALEEAAALDQSARTLGSAVERRAKWAAAVGLLDEFVELNPNVEAAPLIRFQAAVYRWAEGQSFVDQFEQKPAELASKEGAIQSLDDAIKRFRSIVVKPAEATMVFGQNVRYRLAQSIADRAKLEPAGDAGRVAAEREALALLDQSLTTPGLRSFALLLRGELCNRLDLFGQAQMELQQAEKLDPPPPLDSLLEAKIRALCGRRLFDEADSTIEAASVNDLLKNVFRIKVLIARRLEKAPGRERKEIDEKALSIGERLRGTNRPEGRRALMDLARTIDEPSDRSPPESWDLLAEGHLRLGNTTRAGRLVAKGADKADALGASEKAASLRYKAGAYLFEATKFHEADERLTQVIASKAASQDLRGRASMLRSLARGRALAGHEAGSSRDGYLASLEAQVRDFPKEASSGEARWLLGQVRMANGKPEEAVELWSGIVHGHPRWLEARLLIGDRQREAVEFQQSNHDLNAISAKMNLARRSLDASIAEASDGAELAALRLLLSRLELTPGAGKPALAVEAAERVLKSAATPEQHQTAKLYRLVALAQGNRAAEAEKVAQAEARNDDPTVLIPALRLLDRSASNAESDLARKRFGLISLVMTTRVMEKLDQLPPKLKDEARMHQIRALLFSGNSQAARKEVADWGGFVEAPDDELLRELADTYLRLEAYSLAIDAQRFRAGRLTPGTLPWLEARYDTALAYFLAERPKDARQIIDATAILHPDLGGGDLRTRFERLRQKIGSN